MPVGCNVHYRTDHFETSTTVVANANLLLDNLFRQADVVPKTRLAAQGQGIWMEAT
jgi:hypothetical protein